MYIIRRSYNASDILLRIDTIEFELFNNMKDINCHTSDSMKIIPKEYRRKQLFHSTDIADSYSRMVDRIEIEGTFHDIEGTSGNYLWASWTLGNNQTVICDMSNLPKVGEGI